MQADTAIAASAVELAAAKINLGLAVTGRRADGYHTLDSIAVFTELGDRVVARAADRDSLVVDGPFAAALTGGDAGSNLMIRARDLLRAHLGASKAGAMKDAPPVALSLTKRLPVAAGIGGGSADAAATLRALCRLWQVRPPAPDLHKMACALGADVSVCLAGQPARMSGIGTELSPLNPWPALPIVLVNPLLPVSTSSVFERLVRRDAGPLPPLPVQRDVASIAAWLNSSRNDLEPTATQLVPEIAAGLAGLRRNAALATAMSGSGATVFGLFADAAAARDAATEMRRERPDWFVAATCSHAAMPKLDLC
ncbi:4-(cytidine 5'-diphospho)-2-C-methyl-D-erythritol kinase [Pseudohoeflea coraliihabitans]|uniref:4-diphosphocytidyl-2-C-methyl-D-erythritol kinase n=1 Tax=Pseudohoeflea coraliihabitans TaxID=2860393 RepID=A0ABS6WPF5_9HYPH|nr:4-(cytidine 5'-diphospho)-2-C-methyl-D-erythritol kinase [Pseudohoeflea sp. DP4N28-3]MBW3096975.1 4-(cytidine 5'-diphospho)-2-C-methyl-D-erythritol kinase [Pseudohoeflea sp. DP4N28-3]